MNITYRLSILRDWMKKNALDAYIIPSNDPHQSEYVANCWKCREWISGFTGSAGTVVVTSEKAHLWTDSRYFLQAEKELKGTEISLVKPKNRFGAEYIDWLGNHLQKGAVVGLDGDLCSLTRYEHFKKRLDAYHLKLNTSLDAFDTIWEDRPLRPTTPVFEHDKIYAGKSRTEKLAAIRLNMQERGIDHHFVTTLDDIAWIFNIRGTDVEFNPVVIAFALISVEGATLFLDEKKVDASLIEKLAKQNITIKPYNAITATLNELPESNHLLFDPANCSISLSKAINCKKVRGKTISQHMKAVKSDFEIEHIRNAMAKDGAALAKTFYWLDQALKQNTPITEATVAEKLAENRSKMELYQGESFPAIIGYKENGAVIHYRPTANTASTLKTEGILLADSGGQYLDGTTDITRTIALGTPSKEEKRHFTLVLQGNIALSKAKFPEGTTGAQLDILARKPLWDHGLNYGHGTGHGVGFFLNVHEGPQGFAGITSDRGTAVHEVGMITSNEPGYYKEGAYGIRIENLLVAKPSSNPGFLEFETLSLYPIDLKMIDETIITKSEKAWLNKYHSTVWKRVSPLLSGEVKDWFELKCRPMN